MDSQWICPGCQAKIVIPAHYKPVHCPCCEYRPLTYIQQVQGPQSWTIQQVVDAAEMSGITKTVAEDFFYYYDAQGWIYADGKPVVRLHSALMRWNRSPMRQEKKKALLPLIGKTCSKCKMPAVYKSNGEFTHFYCELHMPDKVKERYGI